MKTSDKMVLDTNILIYSLDKNSKYFEFARNIIDRAADIYISSKSISEFVAVLSKMNLYYIIDAELSKLAQSFTILYPSDKSLSVFEKLVKRYKPVGNRVYDIEIVSIMISNKISKIATINNKDFKEIDGLEIITC